MRDRRYIRVGGKPLLLVYRPSLLPDSKSTAARWRDWCRENGIGEIVLAYTQSFETVSPVDYGFDAAIEFPPNNSSPPNITESVVPLQEDFGVTVYDWKVFVKRSERYTNPGYKIFRSVCPSWDNTARRRNFSTVFKNSEPALFQRWLENAIEDTEDKIHRLENLGDGSTESAEVLTRLDRKARDMTRRYKTKFTRDMVRQAWLAAERKKLVNANSPLAE